MVGYIQSKTHITQSGTNQLILIQKKKGLGASFTKCRCVKQVQVRYMRKARYLLKPFDRFLLKSVRGSYGNIQVYYFQFFIIIFLRKWELLLLITYSDTCAKIRFQISRNTASFAQFVPFHPSLPYLQQHIGNSFL